MGVLAAVGWILAMPWVLGMVVIVDFPLKIAQRMSVLSVTCICIACEGWFYWLVIGEYLWRHVHPAIQHPWFIVADILVFLIFSVVEFVIFLVVVLEKEDDGEEDDFEFAL